MKTMRVVFPALLVCALAVPASAGVAPPSHINYQGVLRNAAGHPLDGLFDMEFYFFSADVGGDEILIDTLPAVPVSGGIFSVQLGVLGTGTVTDGSGPGNFGYLPSVFAQYNSVHLEIWVDGEQLLPRMPVSSVPSALNSRFVNGMSVAARGLTERYVDAVSGSDDNNGLFSHTPKQTITAALAGLPAIIDGPIRIYIAAGIYNEAFDVWDHVRVGPGGTLHLVGNPGDPSSVVLDGTGLGSSAGVDIKDKDTSLTGLTIRNYTAQGVQLETGGGWTEIIDCLILDNEIGVMSVLGSDVSISNSIVSGNTLAGVQALGGAVVEIGPGTEISNNSGNGLEAMFGGIVIVEDSPCAFLNNNLVAGEHSTIKGYGICTLTSSSCVAADPSGRCVP